MIGHVAAILVFKFGVRLPKLLGMLPGRFYVGEAVRCLRRDDLDGAMACYRTASVKDAAAEEVGVLHEVLTLELKHRRQALVKRIDVLTRTLQAGEQTHQPGAHLTTAFCEGELEAAQRATQIIDAFLDELAGKPPTDDRAGRPVN